jgi:hypothetical protein
MTAKIALAMDRALLAVSPRLQHGNHHSAQGRPVIVEQLGDRAEASAFLNAIDFVCDRDDKPYTW